MPSFLHGTDWAELHSTLRYITFFKNNNIYNLLYFIFRRAGNPYKIRVFGFFWWQNFEPDVAVI